jgi:hypothetical protein
MAVCTTGAEWVSESAYVTGSLLQIVQTIFWRALSPLSTPPAAANNGHVLKAARLRRFELGIQGRLPRRANVRRKDGVNRAPPRQKIEMLILKITHFPCSGPCAAAVHNTHRTPFFKRRSRDHSEDCDSLVISGPLTEEAQVAAVLGLLSFVPFQILKWTRRYVET